MQQVDSTQKQIQEQKTTVKGGAVGHWIIQVIWTGVFLLVLLVGLGVLLWVKGGLVGQGIDVSVVTLAVACGLWFLYQWAWRQHYKTKLLEFSTHFYSHPQMVIGDHTTREYVPFYVPQIPETVKDEYVEPYREPELDRHAAPILTLSQEREKIIQQKYYDENLTMNDIVKVMANSSIFDPPSLYDVRKALGKTGKEKRGYEET